MKKFLAAILFLGAITAQAYQETLFKVNASSVIGGAGTALILPNTAPGDVLVSVVVGDCGGLSSSITVFDSSGVATQAITPTIDTSTSVIDSISSAGDCRNSYPFHITVSSGLSYSVVGSPSVGIYYYRRSKRDLQFGR